MTRFTGFFLIFLMVLISSSAIQIDSDSCSMCTSHFFGNTEVRQHHFEEDLFIFEASLLKLCSVIHSDNKLVTKCENQALSYIRALATQSGHSFAYTPRQMCQIVSSCAVSCCDGDVPEQVHISLTADPSEVVVMWVTGNLLDTPTVIYSQSGFAVAEQLTAPAVQSTYTDGGWVGNIYTAVLTGLAPFTIYSYQVSGESQGYPFYSRSFQFTSAPALPTSDILYIRRDLLNVGDVELFNKPVEDMKKILGGSRAVAGSPVITLFADMDTSDNANQTAVSLEALAKNNTINLIVHSGDISYADEDESIWDEYFRMIQPFAAFVPYMTAPGNHENYYNFTAYYSRLTMPINSPSKQYYSFNYQNIHFVSWSVEEYDGLDLLSGNTQYEWLINDLETANQNRDAQPWVVLFGHRPLYCSTDSTDCTEQALYFRELIEEIVNEYHVDIVVQAHKHNYERTYPVYKGEVLSTSYVDPPAPVYFVIGTGGKDKDEDWLSPLPDWSASQQDKYGYMLLSAPDAYTLETVFISKSYNPYDNVTLSRTSLWW